MTKTQHRSKQNCVRSFLSIFVFFSNEALQSVGIMKNASDMENQIFQKVQTQNDYQTMIGKLVKHLQTSK